jgi:2-polyprenyl-3-methyl-5-hydroxy-6-metoxy-1,4-benzoquinol methylase
MNTEKKSAPVYNSKTFNRCPICGSDIKKKFENLKDRFNTTTDTFNIYECTVCRIGFLNPMPVGDLSAFYPIHYLSSEGPGVVKKENKKDLEKWYRYDQYKFDFKLFKQSSGTAISDSESFIDIGCGSGERVSYASEMGCKKSFGLDKFNFKKQNLAGETEIINSDILDFKPAEKFTTVSLAHVLEHLENPEEVLKHIRKFILSDKGYLFIQVPNYDAFEKFIFKSRWFCFDAPRHLWHFNSHSLQKILNNLGYKVVGCYAKNAPLHPVSIVPSLFRNLDIQRIWIHRSQSNFTKTVLKILWAGFTIATIPFNIFQNLFKRGSMLTVIATVETK